MTNAVPLIQLAAQQAGYKFSTGEIAAICAAAGGLVHYAHLAVYAYGRAGGWEGIRRFLKSGSTMRPADAVVAGGRALSPYPPGGSPRRQNPTDPTDSTEEIKNTK
ncbi:MAG TPA: hypothetical protein VH280_06920 [Verrucomicrobiae bacterium]|jgi:hypothetical protein|nr:hypothetical protein [Verrucomicrobiae bacterium]